jgi:hypothetical protein
MDHTIPMGGGLTGSGGHANPVSAEVGVFHSKEKA